jgi:hypothetical protein
MYGNLISSREEALVYPPQSVNISTPRKVIHPRGFSDKGFPIPCNEGYGESIYTDLIRAYTSNLKWDYQPRTTWPHYVRSEVYRFYMCFLAYYESTNPVIKPLHLLMLVKREADAIPYLKKLRGFAMVRSLGGWYQDVKPEDQYLDEESKKYRLTDLGDFFNVRFWLFFDQPNPHDETHLFRPLPGIGKNVLKQFEDTAWQVIPEILLETIREEEILLDMSGSSSLYRGKSVPLWFAKQNENYFSSKPLFGKSSYIQKCPGDTRLSITLSAPHSNSVKLIEKQIALLAAEVPWSCYVKNNDEYFKRYRKFGEHCTFFYNRDVEKDGLTKNRKLLQIICQVIKKKYPKWPCCQYFGIFDNFYIDINGKVENPPRGIGLGMSAALTTILQSITYRMVLDEVSEKDSSLGHTMDALFYHDDAALGSSSEDLLEDIKDTDYKVLSSLGILVKPTKSFTAPHYVLCENYSDSIFDVKESYQRSILKSLHASENVTHCKFQWYSQFRFAEPELWGKYIDELVSHFGVEFYPEETRAPSLLGGWLPAMYQKIDISLYKMDRLPYKTEFAASMVGMKSVFYYANKRRFDKSEFKHPIKKIFPFAKNFGRSDIFMDGYTMQQVASKFTRLNKIGMSSDYWTQQSDYRSKRYKEFFVSPWLTQREWFTKLRELHPTLDILPPRQLCSYEEVDKYPIIPELYKPENRKISYLKALNPGALSDKIISYPIPPDIELGSSSQLTAFERTRVRMESHFYGRAYGLLGEIELHSLPTRAIYSKEWYNPNMVLEAVSALDYSTRLPVFADRTTEIVNMDPELFYKLNNAEHHRLYTTLVPRLGQRRVDNIDLTYFEEELCTYLQKQKVKKLKEVHRTVLQMALEADEESTDSQEQGSLISDFSWDEASLQDDQFFTWRTSKKNYLDWRNHFFSLIEDAITNLEILEAGYMNTFEDMKEERKQHALEGVTLHLYLTSGGIVDDDNVPILNRPMTGSEADPDIDIFKHPRGASDGSSSSGIGLMEGW